MTQPLDLRPKAPNEALPASNDRELGAIVSDMWVNAEKLLRQEVELGLAELSLRADKLKQGLLAGAIAGAFLFAGFLTLLATVVLGLSKVMEPWLAALIVGGLVTGVGATLALRGEQKTVQSVAPDEHLHRTTRAMKEAIK
jgi:fatty acid desaturase